MYRCFRAVRSWSRSCDVLTCPASPTHRRVPSYVVPSARRFSTDSRREPTGWPCRPVHEHHVRHVDRGLGGSDRRSWRPGPCPTVGVLHNAVDTLDDHPLGLRVDDQHAAGGALVLPAMTCTVSPYGSSRLPLQNLREPGDDLHELLVHCSSADGPKMGSRGSPSPLRDDCGVLVEPDVRAVGTAFLLGGADHRAFTTSPFLAEPPGIASLTVATMTSPMPA